MRVHGGLLRPRRRRAKNRVRAMRARARVHPRQTSTMPLPYVPARPPGNRLRQLCLHKRRGRHLFQLRDKEAAAALPHRAERADLRAVRAMQQGLPDLVGGQPSGLLQESLDHQDLPPIRETPNGAVTRLLHPSTGEESLNETEQRLDKLRPRANEGLHAGDVLHRKPREIDLRGWGLDLEDGFSHKGGVDIVWHERGILVGQSAAVCKQAHHDGEPKGV